MSVPRLLCASTRASGFVVFCCLLTASVARAQIMLPSGWTNISPPGRLPVTAVVADPREERTYYVNSEGRVFKTSDGGLTWLLLDVNAPIRLAMAPSNPGLLYAASRVEVRRSADAGRTWTPLAQLPIDGWEDTIVDFVVDPADERVLYAGVTSGLFRSQDGGATWGELQREWGIRRLAVDRAEPRSVYAWKGYDGFLGRWTESTGWTLLRSGFNASAVAVSPTSSTVYFAGSYYHSYPERSPVVLVGAEEGSTWTTGDAGSDIKSIVFQTAGDVTDTFLSTPAALFRGPDTRWGVAGGFERLSPTYPSGVQYAVVMAATPQLLIATAGCDEANAFFCPALMVSRDRGQTWAVSGAPNGALNIEFAISAPSRLQTLYAGVFSELTIPMIFYSSTDGGRSWSPRAQFGDVSHAPSVDAVDPATVYVVTASVGTLMRSRNSGESWTSVALPSDCGPFKVAVTAHPVASGVLFATCSQWLHQSNDFGNTWTTVVRLESLFGVAAEPWSRPVRGPFIDPRRPSRMFVSATSLRNGSWIPFLARSIDGGQSFVVLSEPTTLRFVDAIRFDGAGASLFALAETQIYKSDDDGSSWVMVPSPVASGLEIDPHTSARYLSTYYEGLLRGDAAGGAWVALGISATALPFPQAAGAPLRAMKTGTGVWALESRLWVSVIGGGRVTDSIGDLACGAGAFACTGGYAPGATVSLTATPLPGWTSAGWRGQCPDGLATIRGSVTCTAVFERITKASTLLVSDLSRTATTVYAAVNPGGMSTTAFFEYGPTTAYGRQTTAAVIGSGTESLVLHADLAGLSCSTTYHYRVVADNAAGVVNGDDQVFRTAECPGVTNLLLQHQESGCLVSWHMNGVALLSQDFLVPGCVTDPRWQVVGTADFDQDGFADVLFQHSTSGSMVVWLMNGIVIKEQRYLTPSAVADPAWHVAALGDFDGDARPDVIFQHRTDGRLIAWLLDGTILKDQVSLNPAASGSPTWRVVGSGDIDGDAKSDLFFQNAVSGVAVQWLMDGLTLRRQDFINSQVEDPTWEISAVFDVNNDTRPDLILQNIDDGRMVTWPLIGPNLQGQLLLDPVRVSDPRWRIVGPR